MELRKETVLDLWKTNTALAEALEITPQAVSQWPKLLPKKLSYMVVGLSLISKGERKTKAFFPEYFLNSAG